MQELVQSMCGRTPFFVCCGGRESVKKGMEGRLAVPPVMGFLEVVSSGRKVGKNSLAGKLY